uniref:Uncharacterized protein n=1 Tax=Cacopsylla melanoneura TaxID=428564 RepID=A0A8D8TYT5_9HEMI
MSNRTELRVYKNVLMGEKKTEYYFLLYAPSTFFPSLFPAFFLFLRFSLLYPLPHFHIVLFPFVREVPLLTFLCVLFLSCMLESSPTFLCVNPVHCLTISTDIPGRGTFLHDVLYPLTFLCLYQHCY